MNFEVTTCDAVEFVNSKQIQLIVTVKFWSVHCFHECYYTLQELHVQLSICARTLLLIAGPFS